MSAHAYHVEDAPDPGAPRLPEPDGGVDDLDGDERAGDGADPGAAEQPALRRQPDQTAGHRSQEQPSCMQCVFQIISLQHQTCRDSKICFRTN